MRRLADSWSVRLSDTERRLVVVGVIVAAVALIAATFLGPRGPLGGALGLAVATVIVLVQRVPVNSLFRDQWFYARGATAFGGFMAGAVTFESIAGPANASLGPPTVGLAIGVVALLALAGVKHAHDGFLKRRAQARA
jgi:hypothetical protein